MAEAGPVRVVLATHNPGKVTELRAILGGLAIDLLDAGDVDLPDVEETGDTFEANALLKARAGVAATGLACVADDSGLTVDALDGAPGIYSARFAAMAGVAIGAEGTDRANLDLVLARLAGVSEGDRTGRFTCAAALVLPDGSEHVVSAALEGRLLTAPVGEGGFGYDPIFVPDGHEVSTAQMTAAEKDSISHRGKAFRALRPALEAYASAD